ncbi:hypothetical protein HHI36_007342 [Cryptolaemus montrouzieri]|uniref:URB1 C-terminal domain-containing protein n=1 Tax=Cryptolaemus montrouzieri TaxID=559131 RepID=A0ABD2MP65_9CUCU
MFSGSVDFKGVQSNESFKLLIKFCLKYGVSDHEKLLTILQNIITLTCRTFDEEHIKMIVEMLVSHSEFLDVVLSEFHKCKVGILSLLLTVCEQWPQVMARSHVPILLSSFGATLTESDKIALKLLKMYESASNQTSFHDFKPFLWGKTGANHYSVRSDIEKALLKQPKMRDVLNILQENIVLSTIKYYHLYHSVNRPNNLKENLIYELEFLLPLFSHLLAPENVVQTYHFTKSGALSLSILALSSEHKKMRAAACHVLARFYFHVEARQSGKDNLLWIRLIEAICRGISMTDDLVLNNFASIFLARTALILTQPNHIMYLPLSQYLAAKPALDFSSIPELYTFVYSSDVNYKDHRNFICEILCDGLITENDYTIFFRSMALKLFTELYSSCVCDMEGKLSILDVLISVCRLPTGVKFICTHNAMLEYLFMDLHDILRSTSKKTNIALLCKLIDIFHRISSNLDEALLWEKF